MLVKKFEAPSMKEALQLVKTHLGPDAIILAARDNNQGFGLVGKSSVEVTAAVSETQIKKRQIAESKMRIEDKERLRSSSARRQKQFINKSIQRFDEPEIDDAPVIVETKKPLRYIDIEDDVVAGQNQMHTQSFVEDTFVESKKRVREAALSARSAAQSIFAEKTPTPRPPTTQRVPTTYKSTAGSAAPVAAPQAPVRESREIISLKNEVSQLRALLEGLKKSPTGNLTLHPGANEGVPYEMSFLYTRLTESGVSADNAVAICRSAGQALSAEQVKKKSLVDAWAAKQMLIETQLSQDPYANGLHVFVGASGHGKTSALVRVASQLVIKEHKSVAIITTDRRRVGSAEQLKIYSQILNVPFAVVTQKSDWTSVLNSLRGVNCILVDMPGLSLKNLEEIDLIQSLMPPSDAKKTVHLVQSVNQKDSDAFEIGRRYRLLHVNDVIFTKLDESTNHGLIHNFQKEFKIPLHSFGVGPMIPEDYELATKERVIDLIFKISKLKNN